MADCKQLLVLEIGVKTWNTWRQELREAKLQTPVYIDLRGADLHDATLARERRERREVLFPIRIDDAIMETEGSVGRESTRYASYRRLSGLGKTRPR